ncbi:MAG: DUF58 domain-containing protein [Deltaproteobacteria bacterium]|nr:DUF58 domain-containing protein [Deltaproteobacteria bacterium]
MTLPATFTPAFLRQLELLKLRARRAFLGTKQGGHISPRKGHGIEFSDYRKYEPGDNPRHIDWGVYGRTDRLYVKRYQEEQDLSMLLVIDASASMSAFESDKKWERARDIAIALSYTALMEQDNVVLCVPDKLLSAMYSGPKAIHLIAKELMAIVAQGRPDFVKEMQRAAARVRFPGKAIVISDLLYPYDQIEKAFDILRAKNLEISAIHLLGPNDLNPLPDSSFATVVDSETNETLEISLDPENRAEYQEILEEHNENIRTYFARSEISYTLAKSSDDLLSFITNNLNQIGLIR